MIRTRGTGGDHRTIISPTPVGSGLLKYLDEANKSWDEEFPKVARGDEAVKKVIDFALVKRGRRTPPKRGLWTPQDAAGRCYLHDFFHLF